MNETTSKQKGYLTQAWLVLLLATVFGSALAGVHMSLSERIQENKLSATMEQIPLLVKGAIKGEKIQKGDQSVYRTTNADGELAGWILPASGQGFADRIELLIGLSADGEEILGLYVLDQKETPGLGNKIEAPKWRDQFTHKWGNGEIEVVKTKATPKVTDTETSASYFAGNHIQAVTGATVSSKAVVDIVNRSVVAFRKALAADKSKD